MSNCVPLSNEGKNINILWIIGEDNMKDKISTYLPGYNTSKYQ